MSVPPLPLSRKARRTVEQPISELITAAVGNPQLISFAAGLVDYDTLPISESRKGLEAVLSDDGDARRTLQYGTTAGDALLRGHLADHLAKLEGVAAEELGYGADDLVITTGSQQALYLISDVLIDEGDLVIAAAPSYFVYTGLLKSLGADVRTVPMDAGGMRMDALERLLDELTETGDIARLKLIYCQSYHQNPTGLTLASDRRERIVDLAREAGDRAGHRVLLLEDAAYRELGDGIETLPSLKSFDHANSLVATCYTFSKPFAPGLKTGYAVLPEGLLEPILKQKGNHDFGSPNLCQRLLREAMADGSYGDHLAEVRTGYRLRREAMLNALDRHMPAGVAGVTWTQPTGGLYVWLTFPQHVSTSRGGGLFEACLENEVLYVPGAYCYAGADVSHNTLRLCHATVPFERIDEGIARLASAATQVMRSPTRRSA